MRTVIYWACVWTLLVPFLILCAAGIVLWIAFEALRAFLKATLGIADRFEDWAYEENEHVG